MYIVIASVESKMSAEVEQMETSNVQDGVEAMNGNNNVLFSQESAENAPVKDPGYDSKVMKGRVIAKAKRMLKQQSPRKQDEPGDASSLAGAKHIPRRPFKNSRKSRNALHRGLPKKGITFRIR